MGRKDEIFRAAKRIFRRDGLAGLSIRAVAADVGVTPMAIYRHFADRDALIDALSDDALEAWRRRVRAIRPQPTLDWLDALAQAYLDFALGDPRAFEAAFELPARHARRFPNDFTAGRSPAGNEVLACIERGQAEGLFCDMPAADLAIAYWALGQGLIALHRANRFAGGRTFRRIYTASLRRFVRSYLKKEAMP